MVKCLYNVQHQILFQCWVCLHHNKYVHFFWCHQFSNGHIKFFHLFQFVETLAYQSCLVARKPMTCVIIAVPRRICGNLLALVINVVHGRRIYVSLTLLISQEDRCRSKIIATYHVVLPHTE